ncbi:substrate-binding periplasmic protein [Hydrogenophaga atypica]|uniref:Substrate-binding periplasmic protein n=1 Tax=Hydrogenophaga atypica TaxID=249409 RepID=A0ABW2QRJ8_9BURK
MAEWRRPCHGRAGVCVAQQALRLWMLLFLGLAGLLVGSPAAAGPVLLHIHDRPPYNMIRDGRLVGLTGTPAMRAFELVGISFQVASFPSARQLHMIQNARDDSPVNCAVGWFMRPERQRFAKFTQPIYQDSAHVVLTNLPPERLRDGDPIASLLNDASLVALFKQGYSFGTELDALVGTAKFNRRETSSDNVSMARMVALGRVDFMLTAPEEVRGLQEVLGLALAGTRVVRLVGMPAGEKRHIMCSLNTPDSLIERLNRAIERAVP